MPMVDSGQTKTHFVDGLAVFTRLLQWKPDLIVAEMVGSMPGQGVASTFRFGTAYGGVVSVILATSYPVELVAPAAWKRKFGLIGTSKEAARLKAIKLWPDAGHFFSAKLKGRARADASFIGLSLA